MNALPSFIKFESMNRTLYVNSDNVEDEGTHYLLLDMYLEYFEV